MTAVITAVVIGQFLWTPGASDRTIAKWSEEFRNCRNLENVEKLATKGGNPVYILKFTNGEWVAARMEHACCSGAGYNATVFFDSHGKIYADKTYSFCGYEELESKCNRLATNNLAEFYKQFKELRLEEIRPTRP